MQMRQEQHTEAGNDARTIDH